MTTTLYTQPGCGACIFAAKDLTKAGIDYVTRDVRTDEAARDELLALYAAHRDSGEHPQTPVIVIDGTPFFGPVELHAYLRQLARASTAA
ncbi:MULTISPECIES: glutaredoxin family protein [Mycobacteriaceae]|uniref:glutaredoxin family protein n=1 Tax=Mycobacteriaceae TaxID=1762 RepID=UPI0007EF1885|nr:MULTISPECIES: glutaredoxin family protein [Mycobacteriaceae]MDO2981386.1 glutaredoxin family protein [Mycobacteroides abscessus subsp. abscessus]OBK70045.1 NrdH-redoxin [Mycolicibacterium fortuitum]